LAPRPRTLPDVPLPASKRQIDLAGDRLREWWLDLNLPGELLSTDAELRAAALLVLDYRIGFQDPLNRVTMGVRSFVKSEGAPIVVAQRLKRMVTIVRKLGRFQRMQLARMQDIGGCRAIIPSRAQFEGVAARIRKTWDVRRFDDYAAEPKSTGYRAVHVVVNRRGRLIEIQLRTPLEQRWAAEVDRAGGQLGDFLKDGFGPEEIVNAYRELADEIARSSGELTDEMYDRFAQIRAQVRSLAATK